MFHYFDVCQNQQGDALPGWYVEVVQVDSDTVIPIYADEGGTPIDTVSGVTNRAKTDSVGNYDFFVQDGNYSLKFYNSSGVYQRTQRYLPMYGNLSGAIADGIATITTSAANAATSATNAATSETNAAASATSASTSATTATTQAGAVAAAMNSSNAPYANAYAASLPKGVTSIAIGTAGTGGTSGTYALGVSGGPTGFAGTYTISGGGVTAITITNPGLSTATTAPTLSFPSGSVTGAAATATVSTLIADQKTYWAASSDSSQILLYGNNGGSVATAPFGGTQVSLKGASYIDSILQVLQRGDATKSLIFGQLGGAELGNVDLKGLWTFLFGTKNFPIAATDGTITSTITAWATERSGWKWVIYDATTLAPLLGIYTNGQTYFNASIPEIVAARGTAADLNTRLSRGLTAAGSPKTGMQNIGRLANFRSALTYLKNGGSALVHVILDGDSWWDGKGYGSVEAITRFDADSGLTNAGPGWIGFASSVGGGTAFHGTARNNITVARAGTWTDLFRSADGTPGTPQNFPGYDAAQSGADGSIYTITSSQLASATYLRLFCGKGSGIEYSWDGTTYTALTIAAGSGSTYVDIPLAGKTNSLRLRCANGAVVAGLFCLTAASGVVFSNFGNSGATAAQKATVQSNADYRAIMAAMPADTITALIQLGLNDTKAGTANATIVTNVGTVAAGYRAIYTGFPGCDVAILCQPNTPLSVQDTLAPVLRSWAEDNGAAFLDWQVFFGAPATSGDYAGYSRDYTSGAASTALPLLEVSTSYRHPSPTTGLTGAGKSGVVSGASMVASTLSNFLLSPLRSN